MQTAATPPQFTHPEIENLYRYGLEMPPAIIESILQLPRQTLLTDLEAVLRDAILRFETFKDEDWDEQRHNFPLHAMLLLGALRAEESLPLLLEVHDQPTEWLEHWFNDLFTEDVWVPLLWCGLNRTEDLANYVKSNTADDLFAPWNATAALVQIALHFPEKRAAVVAHIEDLFHFFLNADYPDGPSEAVTMALSNLGNVVLDLHEDSLLPLLETCYQRKLVDEFMLAGWNTYMELYQEDSDEVREIYPDVLTHYAAIQKIYEQFNKTYLPASPKQQHKYKNLGSGNATINAIKNKPQIGRNEPCPCGSGKKFKRCCGS